MIVVIVSAMKFLFSCFLFEINEQDITKFKEQGLDQLARSLNEAYYIPLLQLCEEASDIALKLCVKEIAGYPATEIYTVLCINFTKSLQQYHEQKRDSLVPYIFSLSEKEKNNHNCLNCAHNCQVNHAMHLSFIRESHDFIKSHLQRLSNVVPVDDSTGENTLYQQLRDKMFLIEKVLLESRFLEETLLIPKVTDAQRAIKVQA